MPALKVNIIIVHPKWLKTFFFKDKMDIHYIIQCIYKMINLYF